MVNLTADIHSPIDTNIPKLATENPTTPLLALWLRSRSISGTMRYQPGCDSIQHQII